MTSSLILGTALAERCRVIPQLLKLTEPALTPNAPQSKIEKLKKHLKNPRKLTKDPHLADQFSRVSVILQESPEKGTAFLLSVVGHLTHEATVLAIQLQNEMTLTAQASAGGFSPLPDKIWVDVLSSIFPQLSPRNARRLGRIINEFSLSHIALQDVQRGVSAFGSSRTKPNHPDYLLAEKTGFGLANAGFTVLTGGGGGIMEAFNAGATRAGGVSAGLAIHLPNKSEENVNPYVNKATKFEYFFTRKVNFLLHSDEGIVAGPGGIGTQDEFFEAYTLIQTKKMSPRPIIAFPHDDWRYVKANIQQMLSKERISPGDEDLVMYLNTPQEVVDAIQDKQEWAKRHEYLLSPSRR